MLGYFATLSINRERTTKIEIDEIVDIFDRSGNRRILTFIVLEK